MPDSTIPVADAITKVILHLVPPRAYTFLFAFLPGLFFEMCILLSNPALVCDLVAKAQDGMGLSNYELVGVALIFAFIIGNGFMLWVTLIQRFFAFLYPRLRTDDREIPENARRFWALIARKLLAKQYGIEPETLSQEDWNVLYWTLGIPTQRDRRGLVFLIASEAVGWCGLAAMLFAHGLRNRYYFVFSVVLIVTGLFHDWWVATGLKSGQYIGSLKISVLLRELRDTRGLGYKTETNAGADSSFAEE